MLRNVRWSALILVEAIACLLLAAVGLGLYTANTQTALPTQVRVPTLPARPAVAPPTESIYLTLPTPTALPPPSTQGPTTYIVIEGDTLWALADRFNLNIEALIAANPTINPDLLTPGASVNLPGREQNLPPEPGATPIPFNARVAENGGGLRLRKSPGLAQPILTLLDSLTALAIIGRTDTNDWVQVIVPTGDSGWVMAQWVETDLALDTVPVTGEITAAATGEPVEVVSLPTPPGESVSYPYILNLTDHSRQIFQFGLSLGNRPDVFSKVGDSITISNSFLRPLGWGDYNLREYSNLQAVIDYYSPTLARDDNSFANASLAAQVGWPAQALLNPKTANPEFCWSGEAPLVCEYRWVKPSVALIMIGTNDVPSTPAESFERRLREVIEISLELGVVPIVSTIPPLRRDGTAGRVELLNDIITRLAYEFDVPLWEYHAALQGLPNDGLFSDGVHPSVGPDPTDFTPENLQYGYAVRNLTALQALDAVWRLVAGN